MPGTSSRRVASGSRQWVFFNVCYDTQKHPFFVPFLIRYHPYGKNFPFFYQMKTTTKQALSGLDFAISQCIKQDRMADEFTLAEYIVKTRSKRSTAQQGLDRLIKQGLLTKRLISIDGSLTNLYRKP